MRRYHHPFRPAWFAQPFRRCLAACLVVAALFASAAPAHTAAPTGPASMQDWFPSLDASFTHSGLKTATYELGNALDNFVILSVGAGGLGGGALLTAFNTLQSWTVYSTNDYLWQKYDPPEAPKDGAGVFDLQQSVRRTTLKYLTGKPVVAAIKIGALYLYTGSATTAFGYGLAATAGASVIFYLNNSAWDYYDQVVAPRHAFELRNFWPLWPTAK